MHRLDVARAIEGALNHHQRPLPVIVEKTITLSGMSTSSIEDAVGLAVT